MLPTNRKKIIVFSFLLLLLISIPVTLALVSRQQETRSHASDATTSLSFQPVSSTASPIQKNVGDPIDLDIYVDPGSNVITFVRYQVSFDPTKVQLNSSHPFDINQAIFSNVEGPVASDSAIAQSVSIGSDPTKAIQTKTKVGTLHFTAVTNTGGAPTMINFGSLSQALSSGSQDQSSQNVLSTTTPASVVISGSGSAVPTTIPIPTVTGTAVSFTLLLHGVGTAGDNPNPNGNSLSNKNPLHPQRNLQIQVFDTNNQSVASVSAPVTFDSASGTFIGAIGLGENFPAGSYSIKIQTDRYLKKLVPGIQAIVKDQTTALPPTQMIAGDTNGDNVLNVLDYNAMLDCGYGHLNPLPNADPNSAFASQACQVHAPADNVDIDDNGIVNSADYNLFLRELSVQNGD